MVWQDYGQWHEYPLTSSVLSYPGLEIRLDQRRVLLDGKDVTLSKYEYGVLVFLAQHPGWLCSKEQIFQSVWHEDSESSLVAIANTISRIRQKIEPDKDHPIYIQTVSGLGYIFAAKPLQKKSWCFAMTFLQKNENQYAITSVLQRNAIAVCYNG